MRSTLLSGSGGGGAGEWLLLLVPWLLVRARNVTGDVGFRTTLPVPPDRAHALIKNALLVRCRTRVLAKYPERIGAACYYGDFTGAPLEIEFRLEQEGPDGTRVDALVGSGGNTNPWLHERRREELRGLMAYVERAAG